MQYSNFSWIPLTFSSASSGMLGLGWASVARGRPESEPHGLIMVESLMRPGCISLTSLASEEIRWCWADWPRPKLMAVPETLSKRLLEWSLIGLCLEDSENGDEHEFAGEILRYLMLDIVYLHLWCFAWQKTSFPCPMARSSWWGLATSPQPQDFWLLWAQVETSPQAHESSQCCSQKRRAASKRYKRLLREPHLLWKTTSKTAFVGSQLIWLT